jgi:drug/metabolite transporter (DMT)-like permease
MYNRSLAAIGYLCLGILVFSLQDLILKDLSGAYPVTQAMTFRSVVALPILLFLVRVGGFTLRSKNFPLLVLRACMSFGAYLSYYMALAALPMADAVALFFVAPLVITALGIVVLGEQPQRATFVALVIGIVGVVVTLRPGSSLFEWASFLSLFSAVLYGSAQIVARRMGVGEGAAVMTFYQNAAFLVGAPALALVFGGDTASDLHPSIGFLTRPWTWPPAVDMALMAACGVIAAAGMTLLSQAYRLAPAGNLSVFEYSAILWAPLWGFLFFDEVPRITTVIGAALICGAGLFALRAAERRKDG